MENPYAREAAATAAPAPAPLTPEAQRLCDYEAAIGPNTGHYLKYFEAFDGGESRAGWHWPAFFATPWWFIYRKMWMPGILSLVYPWILAIVLGIVFAILFATRNPPVGAMVGIASLLLIAPYVLLPIYANALYWRHIRRLIERLPRSIAQVPEKRIARLERNGGTAVGPMLGIMVGGGFFLFIPMMAAISIPAYQDYTIRSQVTEGLMLASSVKAQVAEYWAQHQAWPDQADLGQETPSGKNVTQVSVQHGSVVITYGNLANPHIKDQRLALLPGVSEGGDIVWACGNASLPAGVKSSGGPFGSDVANKYLPKSCREP